VVQLDPAAALTDHAQGLPPKPKQIEIPYQVGNGAGSVAIVTGKQSGDIARRPNPALIDGVARGYLWRKWLLGGEVANVPELARKTKLSLGYVIRTLRMGVFGA
jgi:hypothetical protein